MEFQVHGYGFKLFDANDICRQDFKDQMFEFKVFIIKDV